MTTSLDALIAAARERTTDRETIASLDLSYHESFCAYAVHVFGEQLLTTTAWAATLVPNPWYPRAWSLQLNLADGGSILLSYAWHGPDLPCWTVDRLPDPQPGEDVGLFHAACPVVMFDRLVLAIASLRAAAGPIPRPPGWSDEDIRPHRF